MTKHGYKIWISLLFFLPLAASPNLPSTAKDVSPEYLAKLGKYLKCNTPEYNYSVLDVLEMKRFGFEFDEKAIIPILPADTNSIVLTNPPSINDTPIEFSHSLNLLQQRIDLIKELHPKRHEFYSALKFVIEKKTKFIDNFSIRSRDVDTAWMPEGCKQSSFANIQLERMANEVDIHIVMDAKVFKQMDTKNKLAALSHIMLGIEGIAYSMVEDSSNIRTYNGLFLSKSFADIDLETYHDFLSSIDFFGGLDTFLPPPGVW